MKVVKWRKDYLCIDKVNFKSILNMGTEWLNKFVPILAFTNICLSYPDIQAARTDTTSSRNHGTANKRSRECCAQKTKISCVANIKTNSGYSVWPGSRSRRRGQTNRQTDGNWDL